VSDDLHLCHDLPGADLHLGQTCPWRPTPDLHLGHPLSGTDLSLGRPDPVIPSGGDAVELTVAAIAPAPVAAIQVGGAVQVQVIARAPAPRASASLFGPRQLSGSARAPSPHATVSIESPRPVSVFAHTPAPIASGSLVIGKQVSVSARAPVPIAAASLALARQATVTAHVPPPHASGEVKAPQPLTLQARTLAPVVAAQVSPTGIVTGSAHTLPPKASGNAAGVGPAVAWARAQAPRAMVATAYDPNLLSDTTAAARSIWSEGATADAQIRLPTQDGAPAPHASRPRWSDADPVRHGPRTAWVQAIPLAGAGSPRWQDADSKTADAQTRWLQASFASSGAGTGWADGDSVSRDTRTGWIHLYLRTQQTRQTWRDGVSQSLALGIPFGDGAAVRLDWRTTWNDAGDPDHRLRVRPPIPPDPWEAPGANLCLIHPLPGSLLHLGLGCPGTETCGARICVPIRRVYRVINTVTLTRVSDGAEIPADGLSLSLDAGSWAWSWSARVPGSALLLLIPDGEPQELLATVNGQPIRLLIDSVSRSREFGSSWLAVQGRGRAAVLAAPTAASINRYNTESRTAQQLLADALTSNGVSIGWDVDWGIEDWAIPAGAWSHSGTYIDAATRIAEAGGGYVQGHDTDQTLIVLPYYPAPPWEWGTETPDIALPEDVCRTEGIEWTEKAGYNAVWITGGAGGRRDYIRRTGTDGLTMAQTVVDALATDAIMTRQRGIRVLGDTGKQALITVRLPVIAETGIIKPGNLIEYTEQGVTRRGLSRSVSLDCGFPEVWQTIKIEARETA
jgi:hypothetical protein